jgi:hypothetical protein
VHASTALLPRHDDGLDGESPPPMAEPPLLITIPETVRLLSCSAGLVKLMIRRGQLQPVKFRPTHAHSTGSIAREVPYGRRQVPCNASQELLQFCASSPLLTARRVGALKRKRHG